MGALVPRQAQLGRMLEAIGDAAADGGGAEEEGEQGEDEEEDEEVDEDAEEEAAMARFLASQGTDGRKP